MNSVQKTSRFWSRIISSRTYSGEPGSGAGRGGGGGGAIRSAGGAFGKLEVAREEEYFYNKQKEQLAKLHAEEISQKHWHEEQVKAHKDAMERHQKALEHINKS